MADLDKELGFCSSQLTEKSEAAKIEEDEDIMKILSSARSRYTKSLVDQDKLVSDLTAKNEQLEADKLKLFAEIENLNNEVELKEESLNRANKQLEDIKIKLSSIEPDEIEQEVIDLKHILLEKEDTIKDYELKLHASELENQRLAETIKHKDTFIFEMQQESKKWCNSWIKATQSFCDIALRYSGDFDEKAKNLKEKLKELNDFTNDDVSIEFLSEINSQTVKLISFTAKEDNKLIKELTSSKDDNDIEKLNQKEYKKMESKFEKSDADRDSDKRFSKLSTKQQVQSKTTQTDLEGKEIMTLAKMLSIRESEVNKKSTDLNKHKVYMKLCENKIKGLEDEISKYYKIDIDINLLKGIKEQMKANIVILDQLKPVNCLLYPNSSFFKDNSKFRKVCESVGDLKIFESNKNEYNSLRNRCHSPEYFSSEEKLSLNTYHNEHAENIINKAVRLNPKDHPSSKSTKTFGFKPNEKELNMTFSKDMKDAFEAAKNQEKREELEKEVKELKQKIEEICSQKESLLIEKTKEMEARIEESHKRQKAEEDLWDVKRKLETEKEISTRQKEINSQQMHDFEKQKERLEVQSERIEYLETALKTNNENGMRATSSLKKEVDLTAMDSSRVPTFSNNIFTQEDEEVKHPSKLSSAIKSNSFINITEELRVPSDLKVPCDKDTATKYNSAILYETSEDENTEELAQDDFDNSLLDKWSKFNKKRLEQKVIQLNNSINKLEDDKSKLNSECVRLQKLLQQETYNYTLKLQQLEDKLLYQYSSKNTNSEQRDLHWDRSKSKSKDELSNTNCFLNEKINELKEEIQFKDTEINDLSAKLSESEALSAAKDNQLGELEENIKALSDTEAEINYFAELIDCRVQCCAMKTKIRHYETKLKNENQIITELETEVDKLRITNKKLESEKITNQSDYEMLTIEVEDFTKDIEKLQNANLSLENIIRQKELRCEELEFKLNNLTQLDSNKLDSTTFISNEIRSKDEKEFKTNVTSPILTSINKLTFAVCEILNDKQKQNNNSSSTNFSQTYSLAYEIFKDLCEIIKKCDSTIDNQEAKISQLVYNMQTSQDYEQNFYIKRLKQVCEIGHDISLLRTQYLLNVIAEQQERFISAQKLVNEGLLKLNKLKRQNKHLKLKSSKLEAENTSLENINLTILNKKERLKMQEIDKIQQTTINEMKVLSEQCIEPRKEFICLDLGREIAALKVTIRELESESLQKSAFNDKLESSLAKAEGRIQEMALLITQNRESQMDDELENIDIESDNKLLIFSSSRGSSQYKTQSEFINQVEKEMYSKNNSFNSLPKCPFELCKQGKDSLMSCYKSSIQNYSTVDSTSIKDEIERLKSEHSLEIQELKKEYETKYGTISDEELYEQKLSKMIATMNQVEEESRRKIEGLVEANESLKSEVKSAWELVNQALLNGTTKKDKENLSYILNKICATDEGAKTQKNEYEQNRKENEDKNVVQCKEYSIVPSKIVSCLISSKKSAIKTEYLYKQNLAKQNELVNELKAKNDEIFELKSKVQAFKPSNNSFESITLPNTIDDEIREKLYHLENENLELQKQLNNKIITSESFLNESVNENSYQCKQDSDHQCFIDPMIDSILYLVNKICTLEDPKSLQMLENESDIIKIEIAQRILIKALTDSLSKVVNENEPSQINIQSFVPTREDDRTAWYLDLLETQLHITRDLAADLQDYYNSIKEDSNFSNSKQLKATYYELASNTQNVSSQVNNISKIYLLIKQDLDLKLAQSKVNVQNENDPSLFVQDKSKEMSNNNTYQFINNLYGGVEEPAFGKYIVPSERSNPAGYGNLHSTIEHLKNELNLSNKIKETLEKQLCEAKMQISTDFTNKKQTIGELTQKLSSTEEKLKLETTENKALKKKLNDLSIKLDESTNMYESKVSQLTSKLEKSEKLAEEQEAKIKEIQKPSLEQMKREVLAAKSKQREKDTQITDLKDRIISLEKENDKFKDNISSLKKENKDMRQELDLQNRQSFKLVQSERDELEHKLRMEIQQRQFDAQKWLNEKKNFEAEIDKLSNQHNNLVHSVQVQATSLENIKNLKAKGSKYKKKNLLKNKVIEELEQKISSVENEKEEYRIKHSNLQTKIGEIQTNNDSLFQQLASTQARLKEVEFDIQMKKEKYESAGFRESIIRMQNDLDDCQQQLVSSKLDRDALLQKLQVLEFEKSEVKSDNIKMCQIIRDYEEKVRNLENNSKDLALTYESKFKVLQNENKSLQNENSKLSRKAEESIQDCENLSKEYRSLLNQISTSDETKKNNQSHRDEKLIREAYETEIKRLSAIMQNSEETRKQLIEKYSEDIDTIKESYEKAIKIQTEHFKLFKDKVEQELESLYTKLKKKEDSKKSQFESRNTPKSQGRQRDSITDLIRENALKESNLKVLRTEAKTFNSKISKLKSRNADLKSKISNLQQIIDSNPRLKRLVEKQKGELDLTSHKISGQSNPLETEAVINIKEYNDIFEQNVTFKIELEKRNSKITQLEEINSKLQSEYSYLEMENQRIAKRCDNLLSLDIKTEAKKTENQESILNTKITELNNEISQMKLDWIPRENVKDLESEIESRDVKLKQLREELTKKKDIIKKLQNEQDIIECDKKNFAKDLSERDQLIKKYQGLERELRQKKEIIKELKEENKGVTLDNSRINAEVERLNTKIKNRNEKIRLLEEDNKELKSSVKYLQEKNDMADKLNKDFAQLENAIQTKDEIISRLRESLDNNIQRFNMSQNIDLFEVLDKFLHTASLQEISDARSIINNLINDRLDEGYSKSEYLTSNKEAELRSPYSNINNSEEWNELNPKSSKTDTYDFNSSQSNICNNIKQDQEELLKMYYDKFSKM